MIMQTDKKANYDCSPPVPLPATPHFGSASIENAKSVEPLSGRETRKGRHRRFLTGATILIGVMFVVLEVATFARLNRQLAVATSTDEITQTPVATKTETADEPTKEISPATAIDKPPLVTPARGRRAARGTQASPILDAGQQSSNGSRKARLVAVIK
jgi:hypothetical protein